MRTRDVPQSGSRGNVTASRNRSGPYQRERTSPEQPASDAQCATWVNMHDVSRLWDLLEEAQRVAWGRRAEDVHSRPNLGISGRLSGCLLFKKLNRVLATCRRPPLFDPPPLPEFAPNPVQGFEIRQTRGDIALVLKLSLKLPWEARPPLEDLMVWGWAPYRPGAAGEDLYAFLGLPPPPVDGECLITDLYMEKLEYWRTLKHPRYHVPLEGSKIFIRVWQQTNGWVNEVGLFQANALYPANPISRARERAELLRRWPGSPRRQ